MDKEKIIELLKDEDIKLVCGITIKLELNKPDYIRLDYFDNNLKLKNKKYYLKN